MKNQNKNIESLTDQPKEVIEEKSQFISDLNEALKPFFLKYPELKDKSLKNEKKSLIIVGCEIIPHPIEPNENAGALMVVNTGKNGNIINSLVNSMVDEPFLSENILRAAELFLDFEKQKKNGDFLGFLSEILPPEMAEKFKKTMSGNCDCPGCQNRRAAEAATKAKNQNNTNVN